MKVWWRRYLGWMKQQKSDLSRCRHEMIYKPTLPCSVKSMTDDIIIGNYINNRKCWKWRSFLVRLSFDYFASTRRVIQECFFRGRVDEIQMLPKSLRLIQSNHKSAPQEIVNIQDEFACFLKRKRRKCHGKEKFHFSVNWQPRMIKVFPLAFQLWKTPPRIFLLSNKSVCI